MQLGSTRRPKFPHSLSDKAEKQEDKASRRQAKAHRITSHSIMSECKCKQIRGMLDFCSMSHLQSML